MKNFFKELFRKLNRKATNELYEEILELEKQIAEFKQEIEILRKTDINIDLPDDSEINSGPKSIRVNHYIWNDWKKFCELNDGYSKKQLISMALKEFMEKHQ